METVRVSSDNMQAPPPTRIRMWFIAGINYRPVKGGFQTDIVFYIVGALRNLETGLLGALPDSYPSGSANKRTGDQEGDQILGKIKKIQVPSQ